jgi:deazaflavin-dependent oxidoreductase (nitroreductase family)
MAKVIGLNTFVYRRSGGRIGGTTGGAPILLLEHVGRKSGQRRTAPLCYATDGVDLVIVASAAGSEHDPAWWLNLKAAPRTMVTVGKENREVLAEEATGAERDRLWTLVTAVYPDYDVYRARTSRTIPVIALKPV